jgi:hypothetical protein
MVSKTDWDELNAKLSKLSEAELKAMINFECSVKKRKSFIKRMHQRYSKLYNERVCKELMEGGLL